MHLFSSIYRFSVKQSQGAITERLRSFSMHDLTAIQGDEPVGQRSYQPLPETKKKSKAGSGEVAGVLVLFSYCSVIIGILNQDDWRRKWQPTPVFLPGESQGRGSLVGCRLWGHTELDTTEVT